MTRDEAKEALLKGLTVKHESYSNGEWVRFNGQYLFNEDGYHKGGFNDTFWDKYQWWSDGWSIVE